MIGLWELFVDVFSPSRTTEKSGGFFDLCDFYVDAKGKDLCLGHFMIIGSGDIEAAVIKDRPPGIINNDRFRADVSGTICL